MQQQTPALTSVWRTSLVVKSKENFFGHREKNSIDGTKMTHATAACALAHVFFLIKTKHALGFKCFYFENNVIL